MVVRKLTLVHEMVYREEVRGIVSSRVRVNHSFNHLLDDPNPHSLVRRKWVRR